MFFSNRAYPDFNKPRPITSSQKKAGLELVRSLTHPGKHRESHEYLLKYLTSTGHDRLAKREAMILANFDELNKRYKDVKKDARPADEGKSE